MTKIRFHCAACMLLGKCSCMVPPLGFAKEPPGGGAYGVDCAGCDRRIYSAGLACICPHCGAWLEFTWPVPTRAPIVGKGRQV
jgi:hypothetical protein